MTQRFNKLIISFVSLSILSSCATQIPKDALKLSSESLQQRQIQTRKYETTDEAKILSACAGLLQDMGFTIEESESDLGVILGSKDRTAVQAGQVAAALLIALMGGGVTPIDDKQKMRASIVTRPIGENKDHIAIRVTFQRIVWNTEGKVTVREGLTDPKIYQEFFEKLSKSVFLEAHEI
jgi:hypothetical protein